MQFGPLDIPDEVVAAQETGDLVIFAGAGVSCGGASKLPTFSNLTKLIGHRTGNKFDENRKDYDAILGEWKETWGAQVHDIAREIIGDPESQPNEVHRLLLRLFQKTEDIRVITTNYDRHFSTAAKKLPRAVPIYCAPALPLGDDFNGIVYLHGSVEDPPHRLVITDADFGRAYLSQGWARTFLQALYSRFHVLFVGFSHEDVLLTYLARGMQAQGRNRRHALQISGNQVRWKQLGIPVIPYSETTGEDSHANLTKGLNRWVDISSFRPQDVRTRVKQIVAAQACPSGALGGESVSGPNEISREENDFLKKALGQINGLQWFIEDNKNLSWVRWLFRIGFLPPLTKDIWGEPDDDIRKRRLLAVSWAVRVLLETRDDGALDVYQELGGQLGPTAWFDAVLKYARKEAGTWESPHMHFWLTQIWSGEPQRFDHTLLHAVIEELVRRKEVEHAIRLFSRILKIRTSFSEGWKIGEPVNRLPKVSLATSRHDLESAWQALAPLRSDSVNARLLDILTNTIQDFYYANSSEDESLDPFTGMRNLVDEVERQGSYGTEEYVCEIFIQTIRDCAQAGIGVGEKEILCWLSSANVGWKRFGYFALRIAPSLSAERKATLILERHLINPSSWQLRQDPDALVAAVYGEALEETKRKLIAGILAWPAIQGQPNETPEALETQRCLGRNRFLLRLARRHPGDILLQATLTDLGLKLQKPEELDEGNDEREFGIVRDAGRSPKTEDEITAQPAASQIDYFLSFQGKDWRGPNRQGLVAAIAAAAEKNAAWGRGLLVALLDRGITSGDIWDHLVWRLRWMKWEEPDRRWFVLELLPKIPTEGWGLEIWNGWNFLLLNFQGGNTQDQLAVEEWNALLGWSIRAWVTIRSKAEPAGNEGSGKDTLTSAINHPAGRVVEFWLQYLGWIRRHQREAPYAWPEQLEAHAEALIKAQDKAGIYGLAVVGGSMAFVRYALPDWTKAKLLPLLDSNQYPNQARVLWPAWLQYGRLSAELIEELPPFLASQHQILLRSETDISNRYLSYAAIVITHPFSKVNSLDWIKNILESASPLQRGWWTKEIARCMLDQQEAHQVASWQKWAQVYWQARLVGLWGPISAEEFSGFLRWPVAFGANFEEAFVLLKKLQPQPKKRLGLLHDLGKTTLPEKKPDAVPAYLKWVFDNVSLEPYGAYEIEEIAPRFQVTASNVRDIEALGNRLIELGYNAGDLLLTKVGQWQSSHLAS